MRSGNWSALIALRERRADQALAESRRANRLHQEAHERLDAAQQAFDRAEALRSAQRRSVYESMAGRPLSVAEMTGLLDGIHASAQGSRADHAQVLDLTEQGRVAAAAAEQAAAVHNARRRAVEKSVSVRRQLTQKEDRRSEIHDEIELEDVAIMSAAHSLTSGRRHAG